MHGYPGNAANDPIVTQVLDDADNWTGTVVNTPTQALADSIAFLRSKSWGSSANWPGGIEVWNGPTLPAGLTLSGLPPVWDPAYSRWLAFAVAASGGAATSAFMLESQDGRNWRAITGNIGGSASTDVASIQGLFVRPTDGAMLRLVTFAFTGATATQLISNSGVVLSADLGVIGPPPASGSWDSGGYLTTAGLFVMWVGGAVEPGNPPVWTNGTATVAAATTWAPPAGFTIHNLAHFVFNGASSGLAVIFPAGTAVVSVCMATIDGKNWFSAAMPAFTLTGEAAIDAAYDSFTGTVYLLTGNGTNSNLWSATVLGTWTLVKAFNVPCYAIRANGREVLVWAQFGHSYNGSAVVAAYRALVSINPAATPGASVWYAVGLTATTNAPAALFALRANGSQFLYSNATEFAASHAVPPLSLAVGV